MAGDVDDIVEAMADRRRDRWMMSIGIQVLRFTGAEIWRAPVACAGEVFAAIERLHLNA